MIAQNVIIVGCNLPFDWSTDYPYQTAQQLSKDNTVICWMLQPIPLKHYFIQQTLPRLFFKQKKNLYVYQSIHIIPFRRFLIVDRLNTWLSAQVLRLIGRYFLWKRQRKSLILWVFDPQFVPLYRLVWKNTRVIYDCIDYFQGVTDNQELKKQIRANEHSLLRRSDVVTVISHSLQALHQRLRPDIYVVPQGFRSDVFQPAPVYRSVKLPKDKPVIGYIGGMNYRLDFGLLDHLAARNPHYRFVLVGPMQENDPHYFLAVVQPQLAVLFRHPNVVHIPYIAKDQIPGMIKQFNIAMIPYDSRFEFNRYCYPMKIFEYFYMGKPVVSTPITELKWFPKYVKIGRTVEEWEKHIRVLLSRPWPESYRRAQRRLAIANSWEKKIAALVRRMNQ